MRISDWSSDVCSSDLAISRKPLDELRLQLETRELLRQSFFVEPAPFVGRVIFVATPHRGSYLAEYSLGGFIAGFVRLPFNQIGRASCRERVCQYVYISVGAVSLKKKKS